MPLAKKQKIDRESNAAYNTSQPLFDALRKATSNLSDQKNLLKSARDTVQALHVKLTIHDGDAAQHQMYMNNIVAAWESAAQTFHDIFHQITLITAEDTSQGRPAAKSHEKYMAVLNTISKSQDALAALDDFNDHAGSESEQEGGDESDVKAEEESDKESELAKKEPLSDASSDSPPKAQSFNPAPSLITGLKRPFVDEDYAEQGARKTQKHPPKTSTDAHRKKVDKPNGRTRNALKKTATEASKTKQAEPHSVFENQTTSKVGEAAASVAPVIEFEDVEAEVDARIKFKSDRYAAKKARRGEKKRKRESVDSLVRDEGHEEVIHMEPKPESEQPAVEKKRVEQPKKKRAKKTHIKVDTAEAGATSSKTEADVPTSAVPPSVKAAKRKPEMQTVAVEAAGIKKRKTKDAGKN